MNILALIFAVFFTALVVLYSVIITRKKSWKVSSLLAAAFMILAALVFWLTAFLRLGRVKLIICLVLASAVLLWTVSDFVKRKKAGNYRIHEAIFTLLYLIIIAILVLRGFGIHLT